MAVVTLPIVDTPIAGCTYICAPKGRAGEYAPLAANPYRGCGQPQPSSFILQPNTWPKSLHDGCGLSSVSAIRDAHASVALQLVSNSSAATNKALLRQKRALVRECKAESLQSNDPIRNSPHSKELRRK